MRIDLEISPGDRALLHDHVSVIHGVGRCEQDNVVG